MVIADGKIEPEEIDQAEEIGLTLSSDFDSIEFREYCFYPDSLPKLDDLLNISVEMSSDIKQLIYDYLKEIADADSEICAAEQELMNRISDAFKVSG